MAIKQANPVATGHTAGIFADMTLDGPEIGTLVAVIDRAKNLPSRKAIGKQDPYCAMRLGKEAKKTETDRRGGQTPRWDQELRFTVREAPDYYKLKCSVFNDDKKTDLIGEAWINLTELIKPGGGSNDLWHQLNYKGKYAGDVRIELTYYDLRPREEKATEKKRVRERTTVVEHDNENMNTAPRQLGPREVRRRPLPVSPATASPISTPPGPTSQAQPPVPPPKIPLDSQEDYIGHQDSWSRNEEQLAPNSYPRDSLVMQPSTQHYHQPFCEDPSPLGEYQDDALWHNQYDVPPPLQEQLLVSSLSPGWRDDAVLRDQAHPEGSYEYVDSIFGSLPSSRDLPTIPTQPAEPQYTERRSGATVAKPSRYRDSPLRHSMNQQDTHMSMVEEPEPFDEPSSPPPPPPAHRDSTPRRRQTDYPPSAFPQYDHCQPLFASNRDNNSRRTSIEERSPLQHIEDELNPYIRPQPTVQESYERQRPSEMYQDDELDQNRRSLNHYSIPSRHSSYDALHTPNFNISDHQTETRKGHRNSYQHETTDQTLVQQGRSRSYDEHQMSTAAGRVYDQHMIKSTLNSQAHQSQPDLYKPQPIRPRPSSSDPSQIPARKEVSPGHHPQHDGRRLSAVPFGPDAYDVLNPASSPVTNEATMYQTPEQAKETARMREVGKLRDQGPIIGNDGRVIDPSDHLPSDTWAPEPERKNRRPEHVIHYRTKNDVRPHNTPNSKTPNVRPQYHRPSPSQNTPAASPASAPPTTPQSGSRNRLQKQAPARPLPTQPYPQVPSEASPGAHYQKSPVTEYSARSGMQRHSYHEMSPVVYRPQLSEYQVPANNGYTPRSLLHQNEYPPSHPRQAMQTGRDYNPRNSNFFDDPLAAELSMIDIGPSRGGQMVLSRRAY